MIAGSPFRTPDGSINPERVETPGAIRRLWEGWKRVGKKIGDFQARVLLSVFYYVAFSPFALVVRWVSDPLAIKAATPKGWQVRGEGKGSTTERATRQF